MTNRKRIVFVLLFATIVAVSFFFSRKPVSEIVSVSDVSIPQESLMRISGILGGETFDVMVARTKEEQERGLSGLSGLKDGEAMVFPYEVPDYYGFWMKDMMFPIDIVWLDGNLRVVSIERSVAPETYPKIFFPSAPARFVAEFSAGTIDRLGVSMGDFFDIEKGL